jgi:cytochrome P450
MIRQRRAELASGSGGGDLISIMLQDPLFQDSDNDILNEAMTFFFAGTLTQATTFSNTLAYLIQKPECEARARESLSKNFKLFADKNATLENFAKEVILESIDQESDDYLK